MLIRQPVDIGPLFGDSEKTPLLHYDRMNLEMVRSQITQVGFAVVKGLVPTSLIDDVRSFWLDAFSKTKPVGRVTWNPYFGQPSHIGFSSDHFQHLYRACDFLWNDPLHRESRETCLRMHALRNLVLNEDPLRGIRWGNGRYGIFITASYYPPGKGHMEMHDDGGTGGILLHSLVPITFQGRDYKSGGMLVVNRQGEKINVDSKLEPGDAVFYDGALKHAVLPIEALEGKSLGRIQIFPIPAIFDTLDQNVRALGALPAGSLVRAKWLVFKNQLRIRLGFKPAMR